MRLFYQPSILEGQLHLDTDESRHCIKVLRLKEQDQIEVLDGKGGRHTVSISDPNHKKCAFSIVLSKIEPKPLHHIHIAIAPTKNIDRVEWFVEKAVEIGVQEISFFFSTNSERKHFKTDRVIKKAVSAMKQSHKTFLPIINEPIKLNALIQKAESNEKYIAFVDHANPDLLFDIAAPFKETLILIGPEGDFSEKELEIAIANGYKKVSLGPSRLRTETAGIAAVHIMNLINKS